MIKTRKKKVLKVGDKVFFKGHVEAMYPSTVLVVNRMDPILGQFVQLRHANGTVSHQLRTSELVALVDK